MILELQHIYKNLTTLLMDEGEFVLGIGLRCVFGRGDVALWGLGNSFFVICAIELHFDVFLP